MTSVNIKIILFAALLGIGLQLALSIYLTIFGISLMLLFEFTFFLFHTPKYGFNKKDTGIWGMNGTMRQQAWWSLALHIVCAIAMFTYADFTGKLGSNGYAEYWDSAEGYPEVVMIPHTVWNFVASLVVLRLIMQIPYLLRIRSRERQ